MITGLVIIMGVVGIVLFFLWCWSDASAAYWRQQAELKQQRLEAERDRYDELLAQYRQERELWILDGEDWGYSETSVDFDSPGH